MAWIVNTVLPGAGLIIRRREWLGASVCILFGVLGHVVIAGWLVAPQGVPGWLTTVASGLLLVVWGGAQWLFWLHERSAVQIRTSISVLLEEVKTALSIGNLQEARKSLNIAKALDDEDAEVRRLDDRIKQEGG